MTNNLAQTATKLNNIAVLIDADNTSAKSIGEVLKRIAKLGTIGCKKAFGDWSCAHLQHWQPELLTHVIDPVQQFAFIKGQNATDIAMVIEAMDLLYSQAFDGFCLVSSDSDFTPLAIRIRQNKVKAIGFGKKNTNEAFIKSCDDFYYIENLTLTTTITESTTPTPSDNLKAVVNTPSQPASNQSVVQAWTGQQIKCDVKLLNSLRDAVNDHPKTTKDGWVNISQVHQQLKQALPEFQTKNYGYSKFTGFIKAIDLFETKSHKSTIYVRQKLSQHKAASISEINRQPSIPRWSTEKLQKQTHFTSVINKLIQENPSSDNGWTALSYIASQIKQNHPNIDWKKYGFAKFSELISALAIYNIQKRNQAVFIQQKTKIPL